MQTSGVLSVCCFLIFGFDKKDLKGKTAARTTATSREDFGSFPGEFGWFTRDLGRFTSPSWNADSADLQSSHKLSPLGNRNWMELGYLNGGSKWISTQRWLCFCLDIPEIIQNLHVRSRQSATIDPGRTCGWMPRSFPVFGDLGPVEFGRVGFINEVGSQRDDVNVGLDELFDVFPGATWCNIPMASTWLGAQIFRSEAQNRLGKPGFGEAMDVCLQKRAAGEAQ